MENKDTYKEIMLEAIPSRLSTRNYTGTALDEAVLAALEREFAACCKPLLRMVLLSGINGKIGTYGMVHGASATLALVGPPDDDIKFEAGRVGEEAVLWLTAKGYGTCWIGGTFNRGNLRSRLALAPGEDVIAIIVAGVPSARTGFVDRIARGIMHSRCRKPFGQLFRIDAGGEFYREALEAVRLAPSALNGQPWRAVASGDGVDFFCVPGGDFSMVDMGIAIAHFMLAAPTEGHLAKISDHGDYQGAEYLMSFRP